MLHYPQLFHPRWLLQWLVFVVCRTLMDCADCSRGEQSDFANKFAPSRTAGTECRTHWIRISAQIRRSINQWSSTELCPSIMRWSINWCPFSRPPSCSWVQFCDGCAELLKFHGGLEGQETWQKLSKQLEVLTVLDAVWLNSVRWWKDWKARWRCHLPANHEPYGIAIFHIEPSEWAWKAEVDNLNT